MNKNILLVIFFGGLLSGLFYIFFTGRTALDISDQPYSTMFRINKLTLREPGYVVLFPNEYDDKKYDTFTASDYLPRGIYDSLTIESVNYDWESEESKNRIVAVVYKDNGDKHFDIDLDTPVRDFRKQIILKYVYLY
jgi:hypothetical protein